MTITSVPEFENIRKKKTSTKAVKSHLKQSDAFGDAKRQTKKNLSAPEREQIRRRRNVTSATKSRERKAQKLKEDQEKVFEMERKIDKLEIEAKFLIDELCSTSLSPSTPCKPNERNKSQANSNRPSWFGEPF